MKQCTWIQYLRKPKILNMSIFDWLTSLLAAFLIGRWAGITGYFKWILFFLAWTVAGIAIHLFFGVKTMLGYYLGLNSKPIREECT
jgi:hypothetical protein